jgi:hypothetical protein
MIRSASHVALSIRSESADAAKKAIARSPTAGLIFATIESRSFPRGIRPKPDLQRVRAFL